MMLPMQHELRVVTADDWSLWRVARLEALAGAPYAFGSRLADWEAAPEQRWRDRLSLPGSHNILAVADGVPVGMATGIPAEEGRSVELISVYVGPAARGHGVGDALVTAVEHWARERRARRLLLDVVATNTAARRLYERHGLVVVGEVPGSPGDVEELRMAKELEARPDRPRS